MNSTKRRETISQKLTDDSGGDIFHREKKAYILYTSVTHYMHEGDKG